VGSEKKKTNATPPETKEERNVANDCLKMSRRYLLKYSVQKIPKPGGNFFPTSLAAQRHAKTGLGKKRAREATGTNGLVR